MLVATNRSIHRARLSAQALALAASFLVAAGLLAPSALADGDPASDVLATQPLFLPQDAGVTPQQQVQLTGLLQAAGHAGYPIRAALIASSSDLGSVTELWRQPQTYAEFLGQELSLVHRGPLLVIMPSGSASYGPGIRPSSGARCSQACEFRRADRDSEPPPSPRSSAWLVRLGTASRLRPLP